MNLADLNDLCAFLKCDPRDFNVNPRSDEEGIMIVSFPFSGTGEELSSKLADLGVEILMSSVKDGHGEFWT